MQSMDIMGQPFEFDWDDANRHRQKNWLKHNVQVSECEEIFWHAPLIVALDEAHSGQERRYQALGITNNGRKIFLSFTIRAQRIRIITARDMSRKERRQYEKAP